MTDDKTMTASEARFYERFLDWHGHKPSELHALLWDEMSDANGRAVAMQVSNLRRKLPANQDIMLRRIAGESYYQLVLLSPSPYDGKS